MKRNTCFLLTFLLCSILIFCPTNTTEGRRIQIKGYDYGDLPAPDGTEWNDPSRLALNKEQPKAWFFSFQNKESALRVLPENSSYCMSLDGTWHFAWAPTPEERKKNFYLPDYDCSNWDEVTVPMNWNISGIKNDGSLKYGMPIYVNQKVIFQHRVEENDWRGGVMRTPPEDWTTFKYRNEVGSYRRSFTIPEHWDGREVYITFDGVDSFFYLWINGHYVGFSKNSRCAARFNITRFLKQGENTAAVEVYRNSDGSFLEAQDMFRLPGIFRSVSLSSTPKVHISNFKVTPDLNLREKQGSLKVEVEITNSQKHAVKNYHIEYALYENHLYSDECSTSEYGETSGDSFSLNPLSDGTSLTTMTITDPKQWSAEQPYRYTLIAQLKDEKNRVVETVSTITGFRKVEISDTPAEENEHGLAGRYYYINGKTIKLKGVNRHETNPETGHVVSRQQMEQEVMLMKRANINHVRCCHYPDHPYWYYLCDKYGIYLEDEANIESHEYYYGKASLSHVKEWQNAHVARVMEMAVANVNHPSIVIWSLGNEAGPGHNFVVAYDSLKSFDASRPVQYERNNDIVDMGSNQYPSVGWVKEAAKGESKTIKYPFHISEYAHSMGNAVGNLADYWEAIESTDFICGGAIWDWVDQALYHYTPQGQRFMAYGGDFGDYPNDGQFVMNGLMFANLQPKPQYNEVKKVYQNIMVEAIDLKKGSIRVFNKHYFSDLSDYDLQWSLWQDGVEVERGEMMLPKVNPRTWSELHLPYSSHTFQQESEYFLKVQFVLNEDRPWAKRGYVQAEEQLMIKSPSGWKTLASAPYSDRTHCQTLNDSLMLVSGKDFRVVFNKHRGTIYELQYEGATVIPSGGGPWIDALRAPVSNDNWAYHGWFENGLHQLIQSSDDMQQKSYSDGRIILSFHIKAQAPYGTAIKERGIASGDYELTSLKDHPFGNNDFYFQGQMNWTIYPDGSIELQSTLSSNKPNLVLPRIGYVITLPKQLSELAYYGRGPVDNYPDRKTGAFIERYKTTIDEQTSIWPKPQDTGNHEEVRWCSVTDQSGSGLLFVGCRPMSVQALPHTALSLTLARHPHELPESQYNYLHINDAVTGLGGSSCGPTPLERDRVKATVHEISFIIRPTHQGEEAQRAHVLPQGDVPITISRDPKGLVELNGMSEICYQTDAMKHSEVYHGPFTLREGIVKAWYVNNPDIIYRQTFDKLESVPTKVIYASSEEIGEGNATHLADGDPLTYWHTAYSVTVAKYPHWVDFDTGEERTITGFKYLPRQDSWNGNIRDYTIQVSPDGKNWGEPLVKGRFPRERKEQKIDLSHPVMARYVRFTALSSNDGQDFATGADFQVLTK